jgi:hypothetical protein
VGVKPRGKWTEERPSGWTLVFDTETGSDQAQQLRIGAYKVMKDGRRHEEGIFYCAGSLSPAELDVVFTYARAEHLRLRTDRDFVEKVFFRVVYDHRGLCIGFNLPFDLSRLAVDHEPARRDMKGGFSFRLSQDSAKARVRIRHINSRMAFIKFGDPKLQHASRSERKREKDSGEELVPRHRGFFLDLRTLSSALFARSFSLKDLADTLKTKTRKTKEEHGRELTAEYVGYCRNDVQVTWECYEELISIYSRHGLKPGPHRIFSEASLGKAYLDQMGIRPWLEAQPDVPAEFLGETLSTYYGGRSEVHIRRQVVRVLYCDFLSMYPTVCTLMGLWQFVKASGMDWEDATEKTRGLLDSISVEDLRKPETWRNLATLVLIEPHDDILPVRARYGELLGQPSEVQQRTIGINHFTIPTPLWYTLAPLSVSRAIHGIRSIQQRTTSTRGLSTFGTDSRIKVTVSSTSHRH